VHNTKSALDKLATVLTFLIHMISQCTFLAHCFFLELSRPPTPAVGPSPGWVSLSTFEHLHVGEIKSSGESYTESRVSEVCLQLVYAAEAAQVDVTTFDGTTRTLAPFSHFLAVLAGLGVSFQ
jgi:hypothetical protein